MNQTRPNKNMSFLKLYNKLSEIFCKFAFFGLGWPIPISWKKQVFSRWFNYDINHGNTTLIDALLWRVQNKPSSTLGYLKRSQLFTMVNHFYWLHIHTKHKSNARSSPGGLGWEGNFSSVSCWAAWCTHMGNIPILRFRERWFKTKA